jgi:peptide/nickel transport system ATP-binding protein
MIFQDPMMTLNPVLRIDTQMIEAVRAHESVSEKAARDRAESRRSPGSASRRRKSGSLPIRISFPAACASASPSPSRCCNAPKLIVADEPTTALDVTIQSADSRRGAEALRRNGTALIWITHDLAVVAGLADASR